VGSGDDTAKLKKRKILPLPEIDFRYVGLAARSLNTAATHIATAAPSY